MIINYKQPYWVKFQWDMSTHHDNQYVTEYNKTNNKILDEFLLNDNYIITCDFKITEEFITDKICMIYGKCPLFCIPGISILPVLKILI